MSANENEVSAPTKIVEVVVMTDGRKVEFAGKRKLQKDSVFNEDGSLNHVRLDFRNGETRKFHIPIISWQSLRRMGPSKSWGDETAGTTDVDDMVLDVDELIARLHKGEWTTRREGGGNQGTSVLMKALMQFSNRTAEQVKEFLSGKSQAEKFALRNSPKIKPIVDKLEAEKLVGKPTVDTDALLNGLA